MRPLSRHGVSKSRSAGQFRRHSRRTNARNLNVGLARGGIRL